MSDLAIDTRASREGHHFHEAWLARRALQLLLPGGELRAIAVEGLSEEDEEGASAATIEIADATFYLGDGASFETCSKMELTQFKYSLASEERPFRLSDARKTLEKFATADQDFVDRHGEVSTIAKLVFRLITNRPIATDLIEAIRAAASGTVPSSNGGKEQHDQLCATVPFRSDRLKAFALRLDIHGRGGSVSAIELDYTRTIADWSASDDVMAGARLGDIERLVRKKAESPGRYNKLITRVDVLAALRIAEERELLPTPDAFPDVGQVVERSQLDDFVARLSTSGQWAILAEGGMGKTVFVQSLSSRLKKEDEVVLFDCFGGGAYRAVTDGRHRPERGLLHIINVLACRGLCDPILPGSSDPAEVIRRSLQRFQQAISTIKRSKRDARLIIFIDAADNAGQEADARRQLSFPRELLLSLSHHPRIDGLIVVATTRPERRSIAVGEATCEDYKLSAFSPEEALAFVGARRPEATPFQVEVLYRRADGNPRTLASLIEPDRSLIGETATHNKIHLSTLIEDRIIRAATLAHAKGAEKQDIEAFLCALSVLPPPVPIDEMAAAFGIDVEEVKSFASDLSPLLDRTRHGIIFRDEPTETHVKAHYGGRLNLLSEVVRRLDQAQASSTYAARALPGLLFAMGRATELHKLAFDIRFPHGLSSEVAKRSIRLSRLRTALGAVSRERDFDRTVDLLVETSSVAAVDERGESYLLDHPELVVALGDSEALRRLFDAKTKWPGTRHARLAIAYTTDGDTHEGLDHARRADEWLRWLYRQDEQARFSVRAEVDDYVAAPFFLTARGRTTDAARSIDRWTDDFGYLIASRLFRLLKASACVGKFPGLRSMLDKLVRCRAASPPLIVAALTEFPEIDDKAAARILRRLAKSLPSASTMGDEMPKHGKADSYKLALRRCALRAASIGLSQEATAVLNVVSQKRYSLWALRDPFSAQYIFPWLISIVAHAVVRNRRPNLFDCLPEELWQLVAEESTNCPDEAQEEALDRKLEEDAKDAEPRSERKSKLSNSDRYHASEQIRTRVLPLLDLARKVFAVATASSVTDKGQALDQLLEGWKSVYNEQGYGWGDRARYLDTVYSVTVYHVLTAMGLYVPAAGVALVDWMKRSKYYGTLCIEFVRGFSSQDDCHSYAGAMAVECIRLIETEDDTKRRSDLLAQLAGALLPADRSEAISLFSRGLAELDAIGSGDYSFTNELLLFASSVAHGSVQPEAAFRLAKICELNNYDSHKFPWPLAAKAFSRVWGVSYLAQLARWHDRDKAELELTLPAALSFLIRDGRLAPEDGIALLALVEPVEMWDWRIGHLVESLRLVRPHNLLVLLNEVLIQYERAYPERPSVSSVTELREALAKDSAAFHALKSRVERLENRAIQPRNVDYSSGTSQMPRDEDRLTKERRDNSVAEKALAAAADPLLAASLESLVGKIEEIDRTLDAKLRVFADLRSRIRYADRSKHCEAIILGRNVNLFTKIALLEAAKREWLSSSPAQLPVLRESGKRLVADHATEMLGEQWGFSSDIRKIAELSGESREELTLTLVQAATSRELDASSTSWLNCAWSLTARSEPSVPGRALERLLNSGAARLADEVGDGLWRAELEPAKESVESTAGMIWAGLGSPKEAERWRAAHAVTTLARLDRWAVIDEIFGHLRLKDAGPFQDRRYPFFLLHAQQWFLLAVARLAIDYPRKIAQHADKLEEIAFNDEFPHVALRESARRALLVCFEAQALARDDHKIEGLRSLHTSKFPRSETRMHMEDDFRTERPNGVPETNPPFHFEYDFEKYDLAEMGRIFGLPQWDVEDRCVKWIRCWDGDVKAMYESGGRPEPRGHSHYDYSKYDGFDSYGTYLARHALAIVGGELLLQRPITRDSYSDSPWEEWLSDYSPTRKDGLWLADGTDRYPEYALDDLLDKDVEGKKIPTADSAVICSIAGIDLASEVVSRDLIVDGSWRSPDNTRVEINSALVPRADIHTAAIALATAPLTHMWLPRLEPHEEEEERTHRWRASMDPCVPWVTSENAEVKIDGHDPYGSKAAVTRSRPSSAVRKSLGLASRGPWSAIWLDSRGKAAFRSRAWGRLTGGGPAERWETGRALACNSEFLGHALRELDRDLLLVVMLEYYRETSRYEENSSAADSFARSFAVVTIDSSLKVRTIQPSPPEIAAVDGLSHRDRYDFDKRFDALRARSEMA